MSSNFLSSKRFIPTAPDKGSFPLDHSGACKIFMLRYMSCLTEHKDNTANCREETKNYLNCRMENNLMAKEEWSKLGFTEQDNNKDKEVPNK